jgi:hypothetical protein
MGTRLILGSVPPVNIKGAPPCYRYAEGRPFLCTLEKIPGLTWKGCRCSSQTHMALMKAGNLCRLRINVVRLSSPLRRKMSGCPSASWGPRPSTKCMPNASSPYHPTLSPSFKPGARGCRPLPLGRPQQRAYAPPFSLNRFVIAGYKKRACAPSHAPSGSSRPRTCAKVDCTCCAVNGLWR